MAEITHQIASSQKKEQHLNVPNINIQPASSGEEEETSSSESDNEIPNQTLVKSQTKSDIDEIPKYSLEKSQAEGESDVDDTDEDTGDDTSTWDSDPATPTPRSARNYYPLKGSSEKIYPHKGGDPSTDNIPGYSVDAYLKTLSGHLGDGIKDASDDSNLSGIPMSTARRVVDGSEGTGTDNAPTSDDNEEEEELKGLQEDEEEEDGAVEELVLTKQPLRDIYQSGGLLQDGTQVMFMPSLNSLGANPISTLMSQLIGNQPSLFPSQDGSSTDDEAILYGKGFDGESQDEMEEDGSQLQRWEQLFQLLEIQNQQQLILQQEQHERRTEQLRHLMTQQQMQLQELQEFNISSGGMNLLDANNQTPSQHNSLYVPGEGGVDHVSSRNSPDYEYLNVIEYTGKQKPMESLENEMNHDNTVEAGNNGDKNVQRDSIESDKLPDITAGYIPQAGVSNAQSAQIDDTNMSRTTMTTWSDVKSQRSDVNSQRSDVNSQRSDASSERSSRPGDRAKPTGQSVESSPTRHVDADEPNLPRRIDAEQSSPSHQIVDEQTSPSRQIEAISPENNMVPRCYVEELQSHFNKEQSSLQQQYEEQLHGLQQQWSRLQQQQQKQQEVLHHLLARQQEKIEHQKMALDEKTDDDEDENNTPTGTHSPVDDERADSDASSTAYSNFTYWRLKEEDTYKALPVSPTKDTMDDHIDRKPMDEDKLAPSLRLKEKHSRHVADLKAYYEAEIHELRSQLTEASNLRDYSPSKAMERTSERLQQNCAKLEAALTFANSRIQDLEKTVEALGARLREQPNDSASNTSVIKALQQAVLDLKQICNKKQSEIKELEKKNQKLQLSLEQAYQLQDVHAKEDKRDQRMLNRVMAEYKTLAQDHELAKAQLSATEMQLYDAKTEVANLKRKVSHFEVEVKRLSHENNKLLHKEIMSDSGSIISDLGRGTLFTNPVPSAEVRKFLKPTAGYNMFTGEENDTTTSSDSLPQASDTESHDRRNKAKNHPENLTIQQPAAPFDSDLDERPLSPMMKAAAQFQRWSGEGDNHNPRFSGILRSPPRTLNVESQSSQSDDEADVTLQDVSTQTPKGASTKPSTSVPDARLSLSQETSTSLPPTFGQTGSATPTRDSSIHVWPESEPRNRYTSPVAKPSEKRPATSPRQLARQSLAKYAKDHSPSQSPSQSSPRTSSSKTRNSSVSSPKRNLAFQFQEAADRERGSALGSSSLTDKMESPKPGYDKTRSSGGSGSNNTARRGLLEGREGMSSGSPTSRITNMPAEKENTVESTLARMRSGDILTRPEKHMGSPSTSKSAQGSHTSKNPEVIGHKIMQKLQEHEKRLDVLMMDKRQLETALSHVPTTGKGARLQEEKLEEDLQKVMRELGSVRMLLRKYNALKTS